MTTYLLHGGFSRIKNESNDAYYRTLVEHTPEGGTMLSVYFARLDGEDNSERAQKQKNDLLAQANGKLVHVELGDEATFLEQVARSSAIIFNGGSTHALLERMRTYPDLKTLFEGKIVAGGSAGAYMIAAYNYDKSHKSIREGLGLLPVKVLCHYESDTSERTDSTAKEIMEAAHPELPLIVLRDTEWKAFTV